MFLKNKEVKANGKVVNIGSRAFGILETLIHARGDVVSKSTMLRRVWPDTVVEDSNLPSISRP